MRRVATSRGVRIVAVHLETVAEISSERVASCASPRYGMHLTLPLTLTVQVPGVPSLPYLSRASANALNFSLYDADAPTATSLLLPAYGPPAGGTRVEVRGDNFANGARCAFGAGAGAVVAATFASVGRLACEAPPRAELGSVNLTVLDADGGRQGSAQLYAACLPSTLLTSPPSACVAHDRPLGPPAPPPPASLEPSTALSLPPPARYTYYDASLPPTLTAATPDYAATLESVRPSGQASTLLTGKNFAPLAARLRCVFGSEEARGRPLSEHLSV